MGNAEWQKKMLLVAGCLLSVEDKERAAGDRKFTNPEWGRKKKFGVGAGLKPARTEFALNHVRYKAALHSTKCRVKWKRKMK